MNTNRNTTPSY